MLNISVAAAVVAFALIVDAIFLYLSWGLIQDQFGY
jgi:hypothetical protein